MAQLSVSYANTDHQQEFQCLPLYSNSVLNEASFNGLYWWHWYPMLGLVIHCLDIVLYPLIPY